MFLSRAREKTTTPNHLLSHFFATNFSPPTKNTGDDE
jgi:hypothetical protein